VTSGAATALHLEGLADGRVLASAVDMRLSYLLLWSIALPVMGGELSISLGAKGGVPVQTPLGQTDDGMPFSIGPVLDVRIFSRLSIETGLLFHGMGQKVSTGAFLFPENALTLVKTTQRARALEVPVLAKFRLRGEQQLWRPFVSIGPAIRRISVDSSYASTSFSGANLGPSGPLSGVNANRVKWSVDPSAGVGVDFKAGRFHIEPEVRYSYWSDGADLQIRKNQVGFLLGFRF